MLIGDVLFLKPHSYAWYWSSDNIIKLKGPAFILLLEYSRVLSRCGWNAFISGQYAWVSEAALEDCTVISSIIQVSSSNH